MLQLALEIERLLYNIPMLAEYVDMWAAPSRSCHTTASAALSYRVYKILLNRAGLASHIFPGKHDVLDGGCQIHNQGCQCVGVLTGDRPGGTIFKITTLYRYFMFWEYGSVLFTKSCLVLQINFLTHK